jgi:hypothetical protein
LIAISLITAAIVAAVAGVAIIVVAAAILRIAVCIGIAAALERAGLPALRALSFSLCGNGSGLGRSLPPSPARSLRRPSAPPRSRPSRPTVSSWMR